MFASVRMRSANMILSRVGNNEAGTVGYSSSQTFIKEPTKTPCSKEQGVFVLKNIEEYRIMIVGCLGMGYEWRRK